jgi:cyclomaltodextrinase / maltogenic alpha-amylase / neopullulanase
VPAARCYRPAMPVDTPAWVRDAVFYQVFPDRFAASERVPKPGRLEAWDAPPTPHGFKGGDLLGIAERLPYLADLGVTALYLTPIFASASNHRYHTFDYLAVDPLLGGDAALRELLDAAHARGMRVVLDGVFNHTGRGFWAFHHILENGLGSPYLDWFHVDRDRLAAGRRLVPYPTDAEGRPTDGHGGPSRERLGYQGWWDLAALPKLNTANPEVREHLLSVAEHWLRFGIDGWRLDVPEEIDDPTFWQEFRRRCRAIDPTAYLVGEIWHEAHDWLAGDRFDAVMDYPLAEALLGFTAADRLDHRILAFHHEYRTHVHRLDGAAFGAELERILGLYDPDVTAVQLNLLDSHDTPRFLSLAGGDRAALRLALLLLATLPGAPCIYYGDEIGMEGGPDPDSRRSFPPDESRWDRDVLESARAALQLRHATPVLRHGATGVVGSLDDAVAFERADANDRWLVAVNAGDVGVRLPVAVGDEGAAFAAWPLPGWASPRTSHEDGILTIALEPRSAAVGRLRPAP